MIDENDLTAAYMAGLADRDDAMRKACVAAAVKALRDAAKAYDSGPQTTGHCSVAADLRYRARVIEEAGLRTECKECNENGLILCVAECECRCHRKKGKA